MSKKPSSRKTKGANKYVDQSRLPSEVRIRSISVEEFVRRLRAEANAEKRFALFLGAGCSVTSGIPAASALVRDRWIPRLHNYLAPDRQDLEAWAKEVIDGYDPVSPASSYGTLIDRLFLTPDDRQREIEDLCEGRTPSFGYAVLAQLIALDGKGFNIVLTTNFDDLIADALWLYTDARPLVIHHESLAAFIRPTRTRPLVIKLHGDHRLAPRNTVIETQVLEQKLQQHAAMVLHDRGIVFMGYGGADQGILRMLNDLPVEALPFGAYWVHPEEPKGQVRGWLSRRQGVWVQSGWFDEVMLLIRNEFNLPHPHPGRFTRIFDEYQEKFQELSNAIQRKSNDQAGVPALKKAITDAEAVLPEYWKYTSAAHRLQGEAPDQAEDIYRQGIAEFPTAVPLLNNYGVFLSRVRKDLEGAKQMYKRAIEADPNNVTALNNYGRLFHKLKDYENAETIFKRALAISPEDVKILNNYGNILKDCGDYENAEIMYKRALAISPVHIHTVTNYAQVLLISKRPEARMMLDRALLIMQYEPASADKLEAFFYLYAHGLPEEHAQALRNIREIIEIGIRSPGWDLSPNVQRALSDDHPQRLWLGKLAAVITDNSKPEILNNWPDWNVTKV